MYPTRHPFLKHLISIILCIAMVITLLTPTDLTVYADEGEDKDFVVVPQDEEEDEPAPDYENDSDIPDLTVPDTILPGEGDEPSNIESKSEAAIVSEDAQKKAQYSKDFLLEDMTRLLVVYPDAVHYEKDGKWEDIDNSLELATDEQTGKEVYKNKANSVGIKLPVTLTADDGPEMTYGEDTIRFTLQGVLGEKGGERTEEPKATEEVTEEAQTPEKTEEAATEAATEAPTEGTEEPLTETEPVTEENTAEEATEVPETEEVTETPETEAAETEEALEAPETEEQTELEEPEATAEAEETEKAAGEVEAEKEIEAEEENEAAETEEATEAEEESEAPEIEPRTEAKEETTETETAERDTTSETAAEETEKEATTEKEPTEEVTEEAVTEPEEKETTAETETEDPAVPETEGQREGTDKPGIIPVAPVTAKVDNSCITEEELASMTERQRKIIPLKLHSRATYEEVLPGIDLVYDLNSAELKETIVLKEAPEEELTFVFRIESGTLDLALNEDGTIASLNGAGKEVFAIPAPYCYDAAEEYDHATAVSLEKDEMGYVLTITPDQEWLTAPERVYPVSIDPTVITQQIRQNIQDKTVAQNGGTTHNDSFIEAGYHRDRGIERIYMKFVELPDLCTGDVIVDAELVLRRDINASEDLEISAHRVNGPWEADSITWTDRPLSKTAITDYAMVSSDGPYVWDITEIAKDWYEGEGINTGLVLKAPASVEEAAVHNNRTFHSSDYSVSLYRPLLAMRYVNASGLESFWDYDAYDLGRAGTAYVNLFTGNMVLQRTDIGFPGNRMPVSITFTYNTNDKVLYSAPNTPVKGGRFGVGNGWRTNYHQRVYLYVPSEDVETDNSTYYVWEDEDGTRHYFKQTEDDPGIFKDESGIELTLTNTGSGAAKYVITDKGGNKSYFDTSGRLRKIENNQNLKSHIDITYKASGNTDRIDTITDGAGRVYQFNYTTATDDVPSYLTSIQYKGTGSTVLAKVDYTIFTAGCQNHIEYADGYKVTYENSSYNIDAARVKKSGGTSRVVGEFYYTTSADDRPNRLSVFYLKDEAGSSSFSSVSYDYFRGYTLVQDDAGNELEYQFNDYGNTVSMQDNEGRALYAKYATDEDSTAKKNQVKQASKLQSVTNNLFQNPSFERNEYWSSQVSASATGTRGYVSDEHYMGSDCFKLAKTNADGYIRVYAGEGSGLTLKPNTTYTFSAYLKITGLSDGAGVYLAATINNESTNTILHKNTDGWQRAEVTVTTPATIYSCMFSVRLRSPGTVYVDCMQLEENELSSRFNLVENGDFAYAGSTSDLAYRWSEGTGCESTEKRVTLSSDTIGAPGTDAHAYKVMGNTAKAKRLYQDIEVSGSAGDAFTFGGWAKGNAAPVKSGDYANGNVFAIGLRFYYTIGDPGDFFANFNTDLYESSTWQYACGVAVAERAYSKVRIRLLYEANVNTVWFDAIQAFKDEYGTSYVYDSDGNITSVTDSRKRSNTYEFENNDMTKALLHDGAVYKYDYDSCHNVEVAESATGVKTAFDYDGYGNNTKVKVSDSTGTSSRVIMATATYANNGNTLASIKDSIANTVTYNYNNETATLTSVAGGGSATNYSYDSMFRLTGAERAYESGTASVAYSYDGEHLTGITYGGNTPLSYSLTHGVFGKLTKVKAGDVTLVTNSYEYGGTNHFYDLSSTVYGNGARVDYSYDLQGRLKQKKYNSDDNQKIVYTYDNEGKLGKVEDTANTLTHRYLYDISGRPVYHKETGGGRKFITTLEYDTNDNIYKVEEQVGDHLYTNTYTFDGDNRPVQAKTSTTTDNLTYDGWGRLSTETIKLNANSAVTTTITYYNPANGRTSMLPATYSNAISGSTIGFTYTYDPNGYIASITDSAGKHRYYQYDMLGQLVREDDEATDDTWIFAYDNRGNITSRKLYDYTPGTLGPVEQEIEYTYDSTGWKDILTGVDDVTYENDHIGNRTDDGTWKYTWAHGRELVRMKSDDADITFAYGADGYRISKAVTEGGTTTTYNYFYSGGKLLHVSWSESDRVHIFYNAIGSPISILYNGTRYYYVRNAQGDIVGLTNTSGVLKVAYTYDAWGKPLTTTGSMAGTLGKVNPLRYRGYVYDSETGLYYLGSRYYDPGVGRFINADELITTRQGFSGFCSFAYCNNNPINNIDIKGDWTYGLSIGLNLTLGTGAFFSIGYFRDGYGNEDIQISYAIPFNGDSTGMGGLADAGLGVTIQWTNAETVYDLYGLSTIVGLSGGNGFVYSGYDDVIIGDINDPYHRITGQQYTMGMGLGIDAHIMVVKTVSGVPFMKRTTAFFRVLKILIKMVIDTNTPIFSKKWPKKDRVY